MIKRWFSFTALRLIVVLAGTLVAVPVQAAPGDLDPTFGVGGKVRTDFFGEIDAAYDVAVQRDGKVVAVGIGLGAAPLDFAIVRYNFDGSLDSSFGVGGRVSTDFFGWRATAEAIVIQPDGKIVVGGSVLVFPHYHLALARFNPNGSLDQTFGAGGKVITDTGGESSLNGMALQPDGKIILSGYGGPYNAGCLVRYNTNGSLDTSFGSGGFAFLRARSTLARIVLQPDGKIVAVGATQVSDDTQFLVLRCNPDGSLDSGFGIEGKVTTDFYQDVDVALTVALQPDGRIVVGGYAYGRPESGLSFALARYMPNGSLDPSFGEAGKVTSGLGVNLTGLYIQPDGRIIAAGNADLSEDSYRNEFVLARFNPNGSVDTGFGQGGRVTTRFTREGESPNYEYQLATAVAVEPNGKLVAAGYLLTDVTGDMVLARYDLGSALFDLCIQDESNGNLLQINTTTGSYQFANCAALALGGTGTVTRRGSLITLQHNAVDRRVAASIDSSTNRASASLQLFSQGRTFTITDRNTANNTCACR